MTRLVLRADAGGAIGLGHLSRAFALGEEIGARLGVVPVLVASDDPVVARFVEGRRLGWRPLQGSGYAVDEVVACLSPGDVLVSDSYELDVASLDVLARTGARHVVVDDFARLERWPVEIVVNPNAGGDRLVYPGASRVLAGTPYALLRREVLEAAARPRDPGRPVERVLVTLGGGSWTSRGLALLEAVAAGLEGLKIRATVPPELAPPGVEALPARELADAFAWADVALLSGGVLKYEAAACGLPALLVGTVSHQVEVAAVFAATGAARALGALETVSPEAAAQALADLIADGSARAAMSAAGRATVDGRGAARAAAVLLGASR